MSEFFGYAASGCTDIVDNYDPFGGNGVALYQFNGDLTDVSTNWDLSASGVNYPSGAFGQAVAGNKIPNPSWGMETSSQITISWWGRSTDGIAQNWGYLGQAGDNPVITLANGYIRFEGNGSQKDHSFTAPAVGTNWNHYALTIDCSTGFINHYRNSEQLLVNADAGSSTLIGNLSGYGFFSGSSNTYSGQNVELDQVRIFNTALDPLEVEALYTEELCICDGTADTLQVLGGGDTSCIATYQLDGNANDLSGNYSGTPTNVSYGVGEFDLAGVFNGSSSEVSIDSVASQISSSNTPFTISVWVKAAAIGSTMAAYEIGDWSTGTVRVTIAPNGIINLSIKPGGAIDWGIASSSPLVAGVWTNITATYNGSYANLYINGVFDGTASGSKLMNTLIANIGSSQSTFFFNGSIDQFRIFNTALTPLEVEALYTEESCLCGGTVDTLDILDDSSCIALYPLDGNANDLSGNYSGTPTDVSYGVGEFDLAGVFNGSTSYITTPLSLSNSGAFSFSVWINPTLHTGYILNTSTGAGTSRGIVLVAFSDNTLEYKFHNLSNNYFQIFGNYVENTWNHVVVTFDNTTNTNGAKMYVNGSVVVQGRSTGINNFTHNTNLALGKALEFEGAYFNGSIDQLRYFNKALNQGEVTTLYNETACTPAACVSGTTNTLDILGDGSCIAAYPLDGSPADLSGNYNGVQTDVTYPQGEFDLAGSFNGSTSKIKHNLQWQTNSSFTISVWIKPNITPTAYSGILCNGNSGADATGCLFYTENNGQISFIGTTSNGTWTDLGLLLFGPAPTGLVWTNYVIVKDANTLKAYTNNVLTKSSSCSAGGFAVANTLEIGGPGGNPALANVFNGQIDQVRIFNKALSAGEVATLYNETPCN